MKKMISDMQDGEQVRTFLGVRSDKLKTGRDEKKYFEIEFHDVSGKITAYWFEGPELFTDLWNCTYADVTALTKLHRGTLILEVIELRFAMPYELDINDIFKKPSEEELQRLIAKMYPHA